MLNFKGLNPNELLKIWGLEENLRDGRKTEYVRGGGGQKKKPQGKYSHSNSRTRNNESEVYGASNNLGLGTLQHNRGGSFSKIDRLAIPDCSQ